VYPLLDGQSSSHAILSSISIRILTVREVPSQVSSEGQPEAIRLSASFGHLRFSAYFLAGTWCQLVLVAIALIERVE
jgi:hypothetical protein